MRGWALEAATLWVTFLQAGGRHPADEAAARRLDARYFSCALEGRASSAWAASRLTRPRRRQRMPAHLPVPTATLRSHHSRPPH